MKHHKNFRFRLAYKIIPVDYRAVLDLVGQKTPEKIVLPDSSGLCNFARYWIAYFLLPVWYKNYLYMYNSLLNRKRIRDAFIRID